MFLTATGVLCKLLGFLYRIFLSHTIGAFALGIYQMITPIFSLLLAFCALGIGSSLQNLIGAYPPHAKRYLKRGILLSTVLSISCSILLHFLALPIAKLLSDATLAPLLDIVSLSLLPASIHNCLSGYFYGRKKVIFPAIAQLLEQVGRMGAVYLFYQIYCRQQLKTHVTFGAPAALWGIFVGEGISMLFLISALSLTHLPTSSNERSPSLLSLALPLTANQVCIHLLLSVENTLIPQKLQAFGYSTDEAFETYGIFFGLVFSLILFPSVITTSFSQLLLPSVANAKATGDSHKIKRLLRVAPSIGMTLGIVFGILFFLFAPFLANVVFKQPLACGYLRQLSFLCPFLYLTALLNSLLQGLGKAKEILLLNLLTSGIRIVGIVLFVPRVGVPALLIGMTLGQLFYTIGAFCLLNSANESTTSSDKKKPSYQR